MTTQEWQGQFSRWNKDNLADEGVSVRVHRDHPVVALLEANREEIGLLLVRHDDTVTMSHEIFQFCCHVIREQVLPYLKDTNS